MDRPSLVDDEVISEVMIDIDSMSKSKLCEELKSMVISYIEFMAKIKHITSTSDDKAPGQIEE